MPSRLPKDGFFASNPARISASFHAGRARSHPTDAAGQALGLEFGGGIETGLTDKTDAVSSAAGSLANSAADALRRAIASLNFPGIGANIDYGIANGIRRYSGVISSAARSAALDAYNAAANALEVASPSKKGAYLGKMWDYGIAEGIDDNARSVLNAAASLSDLAAMETASGFQGYPSGQQGGQIDYAAIGEAVANAYQEAGLGNMVVAIDGRVAGETTEPYSSQATRRRGQKSVKGRTSRLILG